MIHLAPQITIYCVTFNESNDKLMIVKSVFDKFYESTGEKIQFNAYYLRLRIDEMIENK